MHNLLQRIRNKIIHPFDEYLLNHYIHKHPSKLSINIISKLNFIFRLFQPNDRWNLIIYADEWLKYSKKYKINNESKKKILIFCSYRGEFVNNIILGCILKFFGHEITVIYLPKLRSPIKEPLRDLKETNSYLEKIFFYTFEKTS